MGIELVRAISRQASSGRRGETRDSLMCLKMWHGMIVETLRVSVDAWRSSVPQALGVLVDPNEGTQSYYSLMLDEAQLLRFNGQNQIFVLERMASFLCASQLRHAFLQVARKRNAGLNGSTPPRHPLATIRLGSGRRTELMEWDECVNLCKLAYKKHGGGGFCGKRRLKVWQQIARAMSSPHCLEKRASLFYKGL